MLSATAETEKRKALSTMTTILKGHWRCLF